MPRRIEQNDLAALRPTVERAVDSLESGNRPGQADAVRRVLDYASKAQDVMEFTIEMLRRVDLVPFAVPIESGLHVRAYDGSHNLTADVLEGWVRLIAGEWEPTEPVRAQHGQGVAKSVMNIRVPRWAQERIEARADAIVAENGWSTVRGYKLNARQITVQWMELLYPAPADESDDETVGE